MTDISIKPMTAYIAGENVAIIDTMQYWTTLANSSLLSFSIVDTNVHPFLLEQPVWSKTIPLASI